MADRRNRSRYIPSLNDKTSPLSTTFSPAPSGSLPMLEEHRSSDVVSKMRPRIKRARTSFCSKILDFCFRLLQTRQSRCVIATRIGGPDKPDKPPRKRFWMRTDLGLPMTVDICHLRRGRNSRAILFRRANEGVSRRRGGFWRGGRGVPEVRRWLRRRAGGSFRGPQNPGRCPEAG